MFQRPSLHARKHRAVQDGRHLFRFALRRLHSPPVFEILAHEDDPPARAAQRLVRRRSYHMRPLHRILQQSRSDQSRRMRHIDPQHRPHLVRNLPHAPVIPFARIGRSPADNHFRLVLQRQRLHFVVIDRSRLLVHPVGHRMVEYPGKIDRRPVRQVSPVRQVQPHEGLARFHHRQEYRHNGRRPRMGLHVGIFGPVKLAHPVDRQLFHPVDHLAPPVITGIRVPFGVLVREDGAHGLHHLFADEVFGSDQFDAVHLAGAFLPDKVENGCVAVHFLFGVYDGWLRNIPFERKLL